jgi:hypothetical protein
MQPASKVIRWAAKQRIANEIAIRDLRAKQAFLCDLDTPVASV